ncbi:MAG TPA: hypothetical protein VMY78_17640 [Solirubrobacteraceae bacterium]|nr:hypothetical protein [Solirubrobacteraceae bacterium]
MQEFEQSPQPDHKQYVRKVTLPSGKTIEVISFEDVPPTTADASGDAANAPAVAATPADEAAGTVQADLHVCPSCNSHLVYPVAWEEAGRTSWEVSLRCPNCEWNHTGVFGEDAIQRFDETLDLGTEALVADLRKLTRANMEDDVTRFVAAIEAGFVLPEDF